MTARARHPWQAPTSTCRYALDAIALLGHHLDELAEEDTPEASGAADILQGLVVQLTYFFNAKGARNWLNDQFTGVPDCPAGSAPALARQRLGKIIRRLEGKR